MCLAIYAIPPWYDVSRMGNLHPLGDLHRYGMSFLTLMIVAPTNKQLASWAYITGSHPDVSVTYTTDGNLSSNNCLSLLDYLLSCNKRVEPRDGLGDLVAQSASLIGSDRVGGGGLMQKEMSELLWKLVTVHDRGEGKKRKESVY
jgi:hypothetical protein